MKFEIMTYNGRVFVFIALDHALNFNYIIPLVHAPLRQDRTSGEHLKNSRLWKIDKDHICGRAADVLTEAEGLVGDNLKGADRTCESLSRSADIKGKPFVLHQPPLHIILATVHSGSH
jgi:hypothetical protein